MTNYDVIVADFRYMEPPLDEICSKLKPGGTLLMATIEENIKLNPAINCQFEPVRLPLQGINAVSSDVTPNELPEVVAAAHLS